MARDDVPPPELLDLATGYQRSQTLFALVALGVPTLLAPRPMGLGSLSEAMGVDRLAADRFLNACVALGLLTRDGVSFANTPLSERFLSRGSPSYIGDQFARYAATSYPLWSDLAGRLRAWVPGATDADEPEDDDQGAASMRAQHTFSLLVGRALGRAFDFRSHRLLLDLGGGSGAMAIGACEENPSLRAVLLDLPQIAPVAEEMIARAGLAERVRVTAGDFKRDPLPEGFDVALLANLLSVSSEATNRELLARIYDALPSGGAVILSGWVLDDARTSPVVPVLFCLEDINRRAPDVERTGAVYAAWLRDAGFVHVTRGMYCPPTSMIVGYKRG